MHVYQRKEVRVLMRDAVQVTLTTQKADLTIHSEQGVGSNLRCRVLTGIYLSGGRPGLSFFPAQNREISLEAPPSRHTILLTTFQAYRLEEFARSCFLYEPGGFDCLHLIDYLTGITNRPVTDRRWSYESSPVSAGQIEIGKPYIVVDKRGAAIHAGIGLEPGLVLSITLCVPIICPAESLVMARGGTQLCLVTGCKESFRR